MLNFLVQTFNTEQITDAIKKWIN